MEKLRGDETVCAGRFSSNSGHWPAGHRWFLGWTCLSGGGLLTGGQSLAGNGEERENQRENGRRVEREGPNFWLSLGGF